MSSAEKIAPWPPEDHVSVVELARRLGVKPIRSAEELAVPGAFDDDAEYAAFLADLYESRRAVLVELHRHRHRCSLGRASRPSSCPGHLSSSPARLSASRS